MQRTEDWLRLIDYVVEKGIVPGTAYNPARAGKILDANERDTGEWYVSDKYDFPPHLGGWSKKTVGERAKTEGY